MRNYSRENAGCYRDAEDEIPHIELAFPFKLKMRCEESDDEEQNEESPNGNRDWDRGYYPECHRHAVDLVSVATFNGCFSGVAPHERLAIPLDFAQAK
jgi:hypothetical protein